MSKFIGKSIRRKFDKNANERGPKFSPKKSKIQPPGNSETKTGRAIVYKKCFMQIRFLFIGDKKYSRLVSPRGRKFGVIDTPKILKFSPLYLRNASNDPQFFSL